MEDNTFRIKKKYVYAGFILLILIFGFSIYSLGSKNSKSPTINQATGMTNSNQNSDSMADHHGAIQGKSNGFFENAIGKQAPDFELEDIEGNKVRLGDYKGKNVVLFFNEGSMCYPACWNQMAELANDQRFNSDSIVAFSVVVDSKTQWQSIIRKVPQLSKAKILFDTSKKTSSDYDVLFLASSMHKGAYPGHTYFVIDKDGIIRYARDDSTMGIRNNEIAAELEKIKGV